MGSETWRLGQFSMRLMTEDEISDRCVNDFAGTAALSIIQNSSEAKVIQSERVSLSEVCCQVLLFWTRPCSDRYYDAADWSPLFCGVSEYLYETSRSATDNMRFKTEEKMSARCVNDFAGTAALSIIQNITFSNRWSFLRRALDALQTLPTLGKLAIF